MKIQYIVLIAILFGLFYIPNSTKAASSLVTYPNSLNVINADEGKLSVYNSDTNTFSWKIPDGISESDIDMNSITYSGNSTLIEKYLANGKIGVKLKTSVKQENIIYNVKGFSGSYDSYFISNIGNSIWRYSDGIRWQYNQYDQVKDRLYKEDISDPEASASVTSEHPMFGKIMHARSTPTQNGIVWYDKKVNIDSNTIVPDSITFNLKTGSDAKSDNSVSITKSSTVNGQYDINYTLSNNTLWDIETPGAGFVLTGKAAGRAYKVFYKYYWTGTSKTSSYLFNGTVSFKYKVPDPTTPDMKNTTSCSPESIKFNNSNITVTVNIGGKLSNVPAAAVQNWRIYAKEQGGVAGSPIKIDSPPASNESNGNKFTFTINASKLSGVDSYTQTYETTVTANLKGNKPPVSDSSECKVYVYKTPPVPDPIIVPSNNPPQAVLTTGDYIMAGDDVSINASGSYDTDGTIESYSWSLPSAATSGPTGSQGTTWYVSPGQYNVYVTVMDDKGATDSDFKNLTIIEPIPIANISYDGTLKENRLFTINTNGSYSPKYYPLDHSQTVWEITPITGGTSADIKYNGTLTGTSTKDILIKKAGTYKVKLSVKNTAGYTATTEKMLTIKPDEVPVADFSTINYIFRDPQHNNDTHLQIWDLSYSPDGDKIKSRKWTYAYDSDNDDNFDEEYWITLDSTNNLKQIDQYVTTGVGTIMIRLEVVEEFGQPTIATFVTSSDYRSANTWE